MNQSVCTDNLFILQTLSSIFQCRSVSTIIRRLIPVLSDFLDCPASLFIPLDNDPAYGIQKSSAFGLKTVYRDNLKKELNCSSMHHSSLNFNKHIALINFKTTDIRHNHNKTIRLSHDRIITQILVIKLTAAGKNIGLIYLIRTDYQRFFNSEERISAENLAIIINSSIEQIIIKQNHKTIYNSLDIITDELSHEGVIILNVNNEPVYINKEADKILNKIVEKKVPGESNVNPIIERCRKYLHKNKMEAKFNLSTSDNSEDITVRIKMNDFPTGEKITTVYLDNRAVTDSLSSRLKDSGISSRELDVIFLVYQGLKNGEIGEKLFISEHTVENHLRSIFQKLEVKNRTSLIHKLVLIGDDKHRLIPVQDFQIY